MFECITADIEWGFEAHMFLAPKHFAYSKSISSHSAEIKKVLAYCGD